ASIGTLPVIKMDLDPLALREIDVLKLVTTGLPIARWRTVSAGVPAPSTPTSARSTASWASRVVAEPLALPSSTAWSRPSSKEQVVAGRRHHGFQLGVGVGGPPGREGDVLSPSV